MNIALSWFGSLVRLRSILAVIVATSLVVLAGSAETQAQDLAPAALSKGSAVAYIGPLTDSGSGPNFVSNTITTLSATTFDVGTYTYTKTGANTANLAYVAKYTETGYSKNESATMALTFVTATTGTYTISGSYNGTEGKQAFSGTFTGSGNFTFAAGVPRPEIVVEHPIGTSLADGGNKSFGNVAVGSTIDFTFKIKNIGDVALTTGAITINGADSSQFTVTSPPAVSITGPTGTSTFIVRFAPTSGGLKTAALHLMNNDADESPYDINLTGTGLAPNIGVSQGAVLASNDSTDFGSHDIGSSNILTFTITNTGGSMLEDLALSISGKDTTDYSVSTVMGSTAIAPLKSTTFKIKFAPEATGMRSARLHITSNAGASPFNVVLLGTGTRSPLDSGAEIAIFQSGQTSVPDGGMSDFGSTDVATTIDRTFTLASSGLVPLTGLTITKNGVNAADFTILTAPEAPLNSGSSTTFSIRFNPATAGTKTAAIHIASNDFNESPFDITLTGQGLAVLPFSVKAAVATNITHDQATLNGSVTPQNRDLALSFQLGTSIAYGTTADSTPGTASGSALKNLSAPLTGLLPHTKYFYRVKSVDSTGTTFSSGLTFTTLNRNPVITPLDVRVAPGATVTLSLLNNATDPDEDALTLVSNTTVPATKGKVLKTANTVAFTAAAAFAGETSFTYVVKDNFGGTATGTVNIAAGTAQLGETVRHVASAGETYSVSVSSEDAWTAAEALPWITLLNASQTGAGSFTVTVAPNTSKTAREGNITVAGLTHKVIQAGVSVPAISGLSGEHEAIVSGLFIAPVETTNAPVTYTVTDLPPGLTLDPTNGLISGKPTKAGTYNVTLKARNAAGPAPADVVFKVLVTKLPDNLVGTFHGLVASHPDVSLQGSRFEMTTAATGVISGKIITGISPLAFSGSLDASLEEPNLAQVHISIPRTGKAPLLLNLTVAASSNRLAGTLAEGSSASRTISGIMPAMGAEVKAWRQVWRSTKLATAFKGQYNFSIASPLTEEIVPEGHGYGSFTVNETTGALTIAGKLADGSTLATTTFVGIDGQVLVYQPLYLNKGSFAGILTISTNVEGDVDGPNTLLGSFSWYKPAPLPNSTDLVYKAGFGPASYTATGGIYTRPAAGAVVMGMPDESLNASIVFSKGGLSLPEPDGDSFGLTFSILNPGAAGAGLTNVAILPVRPAGSMAADPNPYKVTMPVINAATGAFSGEFTIPGAMAAKNRKVAYQGLISTDGGSSEGYGFALLPAAFEGSVTAANAPKQSVRIRLISKSSIP